MERVTLKKGINTPTSPTPAQSGEDDKPPTNGAEIPANSSEPKRSVQASNSDIDFFPSGCTLLDLVLGGGWARRRVLNVTGDKSTGKTGLAVEAAAGFRRVIPNSKVAYIEAESAFSERHAEQLGLDPSKYDLFQNIDTIEEVFDHVQEYIQAAKGKPVLYIIDSLDALSCRMEMERDIHEEPMPASKARVMSQLFRRMVRHVAEMDCTLFTISQVRSMIGASFGNPKTRQAGEALNFYLSQELWLKDKEHIERTIHGEKRIEGIEVIARNTKNKAGMPYRRAEFTYLFEYGVDDEISNLNWLAAHKREAVEGVSIDELVNHVKRLRRGGKEEKVELKELAGVIADEVRRLWDSMEIALRPPMRKEEMFE